MVDQGGRRENVVGHKGRCAMSRKYVVVGIVVIAVMAAVAWIVLGRPAPTAAPVQVQEPDDLDDPRFVDGVSGSARRIWDDRDGGMRGVMVTLIIPRGGELAIGPVEDESGRAADDVEIVSANGTAFLRPSRVRRIRFSSVGRGESKLVLSVRLKRCAQLFLGLWENDGKATPHRVLKVDDSLPSCCSTSAAADGTVGTEGTAVAEFTERAGRCSEGQ